MSGNATVLVTGASSQLGVFLLPRLVSVGFSVVALSRRIRGGPVEPAERVAWAHPARPPGGPVKYLVSCGPPGLASELLEDRPEIEKAVVFSTSSILTKSGSPDRGERELMAAILAEEQKLRTVCEERGTDLVVLRPTLIYGCGLDRNLSLLLRLGERTGFIPVSSNAAGLRQPVHADDLAGLAVAALVTNTGEYLESVACGGSTLVYREMVNRLAGCGARKIRVQPLPQGLLAALVRTASILGSWKGINPEMVSRQSIDMTFDDSAVRTALAYTPRPFAPTPEDFRIPPQLQNYRPLP